MIKKITFLLLLFTTMNCFAVNCDYLCRDDLSGQSEMNKCSYDSYLEADKELRSIYLKILNKNKNYRDAYNSTMIAQKAWVQFRDAQVKMKFPKLKQGHYYGSMHPVLENCYLTDLTNQRIEQLLDVLNDNYVDQLNE